MTTQATNTQVKDLSFTEFQAMKAIPKGHVYMRNNAPGTWRLIDRPGRAGFVITKTMRALIDRGLVKPRTDYVAGKRLADITPAGYEAMSKAAHTPPKKNAKKRRR